MSRLASIIGFLASQPASRARAGLSAIVAANGATLSTASRDGIEDNAAPSARAAFEADMRPVVRAVVGALEDGDLEAIHGLRSLLPHLLEEVNGSPELADELARQMGRALVQGFISKPEDAL